MRNVKYTALLSLTLCVLLLAGCGGAGAPAQTTAAPAQSAEAAEIPDGAVEVDNIDDMLAAIKDGAHIYLAPGVYDLSKAESYGSGTGGTYSWLETGDGSQLMISDVQDLTIEAQDAEKTIISALPRYATVMNFMNCENLTLKNITLGHVEGAGVCSGGVLYLGNCRGVTVDDCALFGCGTIGVQAEYSDSISVKNTEIYDCSYGASWIIGCYDMCFENCEIFDCAAIGAGLFAVENSAEIAVINSNIHDNNGSAMLACSYSKGVYFGGNTVSGNGFEGMFFCAKYPAVVENCSIEKGSAAWFFDSPWYGTANELVCAIDGETLSGSDLAAMKQSDVSWTAKPRTAPADTASETDGDGYIRVSTVDELLSAIAPGASIFLEAGVYDLSSAEGYGAVGGEYYYWQECYDGPELIISGVDGLTIEAESADAATICAEPRYADVLSFESCSNITLKNFTAGHTEEPGSCTGGVLYLDGCTYVTVEGCALYGCGVVGINATGCRTMTVNGCEIYDCSYDGINLHTCSGVSILSTEIHDNGGCGIYLNSCSDVAVDGCLIHDNKGSALTSFNTTNLSYDGEKLVGDVDIG